MCKTCLTDFKHSVKSLKGERAVGSNFWKPGQEITISFLSGTSQQKDFVKRVASKWQSVTGLTFKWVDSGMIRIDFQNDGSWSYIGTENLSIPVNEPTMNFGWIDEDIQMNDESTVLHEFGHMVGLEHEHQNPSGGIKWNKSAVIKDLSGPPNNWDLATIQHNVFDLSDSTNYTKFDPDSIMLYPFPSSWTLDGMGTKANKTISKTDSSFMAEIYHSNPSPSLKQVFTSATDIRPLSLSTLRRWATFLKLDPSGTRNKLADKIFNAL